jgi:hypothetical protein
MGAWPEIPSLAFNREPRCMASTGCWPSHPPLSAAKADRNHLNEYNTSHLPTGIGERYSQTISNLGCQAALLRRCELPRKCWTNSMVSLFQSLHWGGKSLCYNSGNIACGYGGDQISDRGRWHGNPPLAVVAIFIYGASCASPQFLQSQLVQ